MAVGTITNNNQQAVNDGYGWRMRNSIMVDDGLQLGSKNQQHKQREHQKQAFRLPLLLLVDCPIF